MAKKKHIIGWIGLGKMGLPLARRLLAEGHDLVVYDIASEKTEPLAAKGAKAVRSAREASRSSEFIFTMVSNDQALAEAVMGPDGALAEAPAGAVLVDMGTHSVETSAIVAKRAKGAKLAFLRAPVSGTRMHAENGTLMLFASGSEAIYRRCIPLFNVFATKSYWIGEGEEARYLKLLHNTMLGVTALMLAEALSFGQKGGVKLSQMLDVLNDSVVASPVMGYKTEALKHRTFDLTFTASQMAKDLDLALAAAGHLQMCMPLAATVRQFMGAMIGTGRGEEDFFAILKVMEDLAGLKR